MSYSLTMSLIHNYEALAKREEEKEAFNALVEALKDFLAADSIHLSTAPLGKRSPLDGRMEGTTRTSTRGRVKRFMSS